MTYNNNSYKTSKVFTSIRNTEYKNLNHSCNKFPHNSCNINKFTLLHQNIREINNKIEEFLISLSSDAPQIISVTEHHLKKEELGIVNFSHYTLGAFFCRQSASHGGVCIFVPKNIQYYTIDLGSFNKEKDFEVCALKLNILSISLTVICIYRSQTGNFLYFINQLELILNKIYKSSSELIL